jgi:hypothetical protein
MSIIKIGRRVKSIEESPFCTFWRFVSPKIKIRRCFMSDGLGLFGWNFPIGKDFKRKVESSSFSVSLLGVQGSIESKEKSRGLRVGF